MTVVERLREARERQKVSLHAIAEKTNVSVRFLDAIEKNQFDKLPGGIFTRGFIRSYARQVGLDPDATVQQFLADEPSQRDDDIDEVPARIQGDGPGIGTLVLAGVAVIVVALALVYFIHHISASIQISRLATGVRDQLVTLLDDLYPEQTSTRRAPATRWAAIDSPIPPVRESS